MGWVRDPRLLEPEPPSEEIADDIVAAFESSRRRMLIVGEAGSGKTIAAYSLIEYLDGREGDERTPLLVNLSAWEAEEGFTAFLIDYLRSSVGYEVPERAVAAAFIGSDRYSLILDGLDEIPAELRTHFSERFDEFVSGLPDEVGVVVTCRTQEYKQLLAAHATGLGLVQAVQMLPLTDEQLDSAFVELAKQRDKEWGLFLAQRDLTAYQRVRQLLSNPLLLNLAVVGHLDPDQLLDWTTAEEELRDLVLDSYLDRTLADQREYEPADARRYLTWIARFLNGDEVSPFGLKTTDYTVFDLADLTPPDPPRRYRFFQGLVVGLGFGLGFGLVLGLAWGLFVGLGVGLGFALPRGTRDKPSAVSSRLPLASWPSTRGQLLGILRARRGWVVGLGLWLGLWLLYAVFVRLSVGLVVGLYFGLVLVLFFVLGFLLPRWLFESRSVLITSRTPKEARSRSLIAALTWLGSWLVFGGLVLGLGLGLVRGGLGAGLGAGLRAVRGLNFGAG